MMLLSESLRKITEPMSTPHPTLPPYTKKETVGFRNLRARQAPDSAKYIPLSSVGFSQFGGDDYSDYDYQYETSDDATPIVTMSREKTKVNLGTSERCDVPCDLQPSPPQELKSVPQPSPRLKNKTNDVSEFSNGTFHNCNFHFG